MYYYIGTAGRDANTAGVKAPQDISTLLERRGYQMIPFRSLKKFTDPHKEKIYSIVVNVLNWVSVLFKVKMNSLVVVQYPYSVSKVALYLMPVIQKIRKSKFVFVLHDVDSIRGYAMNASAPREACLEKADYLICHNASMKKWLIEHHIPEEKLICLDVFDYLHNIELPDKREFQKSVIIAGNLAARKSPYIAKLLEVNRGFQLYLYGPNFEKDQHYRDYTYFGVYPPEKLPEVLKGGFGLVWDGESLDACTGMTGEYLRYNNPHKVSLYIASGVPVIIWKEAALAHYIEKNKLGFTVSSLKELDEKLSTVSQQEYQELYMNVMVENRKLRAGYYFEQVIKHVEKLQL